MRPLSVTFGDDVDLEQFLRIGRKEMSQLCSGDVREEFGEMPPCQLHLKENPA